MPRLFVIGFSPAPWVLNLEGYATQAAAQEAISWQRQAEPNSSWEICTRSGAADFTNENGETHHVEDRSPYTVAGWSEFLAAWWA